MFNKGDIVSIPFSLLFDEYKDELDMERENFPFSHKEMVYGVVSIGYSRGYYFVKWNVEGIFGIFQDEVNRICNIIYDQINIYNIIYDQINLEFVRCKEDLR